MLNIITALCDFFSIYNSDLKICLTLFTPFKIKKKRNSYYVVRITINLKLITSRLGMIKEALKV